MASIALLTRPPAGPGPVTTPNQIAKPAYTGVSEGNEARKEDPLARFPDKLSSPLCWDARSFPKGTGDYIIQFTADDLASIDNAVTSFRGTPSQYLFRVMCAILTL